VKPVRALENPHVTLNVNGKPRKLDVPDDMPLLWTLRDVLSMTGTKFGCGAGLCGACTIHIDGQPTRSCITPVSAAAGKRITTIEAIGTTLRGPESPGGLACVGRAAMRLLPVRPDHVGKRAAGRQSEAERFDIDDAMAGNICRCGTYPRIRAAIKRAAGVTDAGT
jgi:isoquinoline 1-oxidoreductase alpha subunit